MKKVAFICLKDYSELAVKWFIFSVLTVLAEQEGAISLLWDMYCRPLGKCMFMFLMLSVV